VQSAIIRLEKAMSNKGGINGLPSGYADFDEMTNGMHGAEMLIIAARPSMGKTSLVMNIVEHISVNLRKPSAVFSLEMSADQLVERLICSRARVSMNQIRAGLVASGEFSRISYAADELLRAPIFIDDTPSLSIGDFKAKVRRLKKDHKIELVAIDYLQLMRSTTRRASENRQIEIAEISSGIKAMAKELEIPIIVLAQLNRSSEKREGNRPMMSDLRESGSIEQDADLVALLMRPEYYAKDGEEREEKKGEVELLIAKQRNGPTGIVKLTFLNEYMRFENRAPEHTVPH
jgi:replicative DNA helicase